MPVRARSRCFEIDQEAVAVVLDGAQLVEVGVEAVGDHAAVAHQRGGLGEQGAAQQSGAALGRRAGRAPMPCSSAAGLLRAELSRQLLRRAPASAPGPPVRAASPGASAVRAVMRSTSLAPLSACAQALPQAVAQGGDGVQPRARLGAVAPGLQQPAAQRRLPMPVWQMSSSENSVGLVSPRRVCVSSRLRRVLSGRSISSSLRATCRLFTWVSARPCVCSA